MRGGGRLGDEDGAVWAALESWGAEVVGGVGVEEGGERRGACGEEG